MASRRRPGTLRVILDAGPHPRSAPLPGDDARAGDPPPLRHLLVASDGSPAADAAVDLAFALAPEDGRVTLVHAEREPEAVAAWQQRLSAIAATAPSGLPVRTEVVTGRPADAVLDVAARTDADLLLTGTRGRGRVRRTLLGSVSTALLGHADAPVLVVPAPSDDGTAGVADRPGAVVAAVDGSLAAFGGVEAAEVLALRLRAGLVLAHVADPRLPFAQHPGKAVRDELARHGRVVLADAHARARTHDRVTEELLEGDPRTQLLAACGRHAPALLVVGSRGFGAVHSAVVGSTARGLAAAAPCPVLVTRPG